VSGCPKILDAQKSNKDAVGDTGYFSAERSRAKRGKAGLNRMIAMGRQPHHPPLQETLRTSAGAKKSDAGRGLAHR